MTPAQKAKSMGFKSLKEVSEICNKSCATLGNWHRDNPIAFHAMLLGCSMFKESEDDGKVMKVKWSAKASVNFADTKEGRITDTGQKTFFVQGDPNLNLNGVRMHEGEFYEVFPDDYIEIYQSEK